jgi:hypothetical protein
VVLKNMKSKYKKELQSIYEMSLSDDTEAKDLAISLFWTSEYVKDNEITPYLQISGFNKQSIEFYINKKNKSRYYNFSYILDDLIHDKIYFNREELK